MASIAPLLSDEESEPNQEVFQHILALIKKDASREMSLRQLTVLMLLASESENPWTVRALARKTGLSKPVITRAMNTLSKLGFAIRTKDANDGRSVFLSVTLRGQDFLFV